jgi:hypothetical protein
MHSSTQSLFSETTPHEYKLISVSTQFHSI